MPIELWAVGALFALTLLTVGMIFMLGAPPVSVRAKEAEAVVRLLAPLSPAHIDDLGAGWGALVIALARAFPKARVVGHELSPLPWAIAKLRTARLKNARIRFGDFRRATLDGAVVCYLARAPMTRVAALLDRNARPGTPVVTVCFLFRGKTPVSTERATGLGGEVALYRW